MGSYTNPELLEDWDSTISKVGTPKEVSTCLIYA